MLKAQGKTIIMDEGDYGLSLPFKVSGGDIMSTDTIEFRIKTSEYDEDTILKKEYTNLSEEDGKFVFDLSFNETESASLPAGEYQYGLKQYRNGEFLNTVRKSAPFKVDKGV